MFGKVGKGQENQEGCSGDREESVTSEGLTPLHFAKNSFSKEDAVKIFKEYIVKAIEKSINIH